MIDFVALPYSPWSEKARWALDHHAVPYRETLYLPLLGEPWMRVRRRRATGPVSVPALFHGKQRYTDSWSIALYADRVGGGTPLFPMTPAGDGAAIKAFDELGERGLRAGRALALDRVLRADDALAELLPKPLRDGLGPVGRAIAAFGVRRTLRKYGANRTTLTEHEAQLVGVLDEIRAALGRTANGGGEPRYLLGRFTYADVSASQVLQFVSPVAASVRSVVIGRASRACFEHPVVAGAYHDLLAWRDALYAAHRGRFLADRGRPA
jgi:glutathione S-transferase